MANHAWLCRSEGILLQGNDTSYSSIYEKYRHTVKPTASTLYSILAGLCTAEYGTSFAAKSKLVVDATVAQEGWFDPGQNQISCLPAIVPFQATKSANFDIFSQAANDTNSSSGSGFGVGPTGSLAWDIQNVQYTSFTTEKTTSSSTFQDELTLTFTPSQAQDYLIVAHCRIRCTNTSAGQPQARLLINGTDSGDADGRSYGTGDYLPVTITKKISLAASSQTIKLQLASGDNFWTCGMTNAMIMAIPLSGYTTGYNEGSNSTSTGSFADAASATITPAVSSTYLIIASCELTGSNAAQSVRLNINGQAYTSAQVPCKSSGRLAIGMITPVVLPSGSIAVKLQTQNASFTNPRIFAIDLTGDAQELKVCYANGVQTGNDDCQEQVDTGSMTLAGTRNQIGKDISNHTFDLGVRTTNVDVKQGATIDHAYLNMAPFSLQSSAFAILVSAFNEDNTATFSTSSDFLGRSLSTGTSWTPGTVNQDKFQQSADIAAEVQTVANRANFAQWNALGMRLLHASAAAQSLYLFENYDTSIPLSADFLIQWKEILPKVQQPTFPLNPKLRPAIFTPGH